MSITEIRPCTTYAKQVDILKYNKDPIAHTVQNKTVEEFRKSEKSITSLGLSLSQGDATGATLYFQAARCHNLAVLDYLCTKAQPTWLGLGNHKGLIPLHAPLGDPYEKVKNPAIIYTLLTFGSPINITTTGQWFQIPPSTTPLDMALINQDWRSACILKFNGGLCNLPHYPVVTKKLDDFISQKEGEAAELTNKIISFDLFPTALVSMIAKYAIYEFKESLSHFTLNDGLERL